MHTLRGISVDINLLSMLVAVVPCFFLHSVAVVLALCGVLVLSILSIVFLLSLLCSCPVLWAVGCGAVWLSFITLLLVVLLFHASNVLLTIFVLSLINSYISSLIAILMSIARQTVTNQIKKRS